MRQAHKVFKRDWGRDAGLLGVEHAQIGLGKQLAALVVELPGLESFIADGEVHLVGIEVVEQPGCVQIVKPEMNAGGDLAYARQQSGHDQDFHAVRQSKPERSHRRCWVKGLVARHQRLNLRQRRLHGLEQRHGARGEAHAIRPAREKFVVEQIPQARELWLIAD